MAVCYWKQANVSSLAEVVGKQYSKFLYSCGWEIYLEMGKILL